MAVIDIGSAWATGDQLTPAAMNAKWADATFNSAAVDDSSTALSSGAVIVKDAGITSEKLAAGAVTTLKVANSSIIPGHLYNVQDWSGIDITLPDNVVYADRIVDDNVTFVKLAAADNATQANMEAEAASKRVTPDVIINHPGVAKAYGEVTLTTATPALSGEYNATLTADTTLTRTITIPEMSGSDYVVVLSQGAATPNESLHPSVSISSATEFVIHTPLEYPGVSAHFTVYGDLA